MTDDTGILQHARSSIGDRRQGYTTDDNARALLVVLRSNELLENYTLQQLAKIYLSFLIYSQQEDGHLHNFIGYDRRFRDEQGSDDSLGRALWVCGYTQDTSLPDEFKVAAKEVFDDGLKWVLKSNSPRTKAFAILGLYHYANAFPEDKNPRLNVIHLADQISGIYKQASSPEWDWFEPYLTYANPRLPQALFRAYQITGKQDYLQTAENTLRFLAATNILEGIYQPVGSEAWYEKDGEKSLYDQQPLEASCMVEAASNAFQATGNKMYVKLAQTAFSWFMGKNTKKVVVYNPTNGGCFDGITAQGLNRNQGAEAGLSYLLARLEMEVLSRQKIRIPTK